MNKTSNIALFYISNIVLISLIVFFILTLFIYPKDIFDATKTGLLLWYNNILPSTFFFFVIINISASLLTDMANKKYMYQVNEEKNISYKKKFFNTCFTSFLLGHMSGFPIGGKLASDAIDDGITKKDMITSIYALSSASSPIFLLSAIGVNIFKNKYVGYILILSQLLSNVLVFIIFNLKYLIIKDNDNSNSDNKSKKYDSNKINNTSKMSILSNSLSYASETLINICATIVFFCILIKIIQIYQMDELFFNISSFLLNKINISLLGKDYKNVVFSLFYGLIEITNGIYYLSTTSLSNNLSISLISALTTFGGICVHIQLSNTFLLSRKHSITNIDNVRIDNQDNLNITLSSFIDEKSFIIKKLLASIIAFIITYIITRTMIF